MAAVLDRQIKKRCTTWNGLFLSALLTAVSSLGSVPKDRYHPQDHTSPRPPITTVSQTALTASSHTALNSPRPPCTPLKRLRTSSTALALAAALAPTSAPAPAAATAAVALCRRRKKRTNTASVGSTTQRVKIGAWRRYGRSASNHDDADGVSACHEMPAYRSAGVGGVLLRGAVGAGGVVRGGGERRGGRRWRERDQRVFCA